MSSTSIASCAALLFLSSVVFGCAPPQACPPAATAATSSSPASAVGAPVGPSRLPGGADRHVYRFDFVLSASDPSGGSPSSTTFTLNLQEADKGEVVVGKNVSLSAPAPGGSSPPAASARQDVGVKVAASFRMAATGDDVVLEVVTEMSAFEPPATIRKMVMKGNAIAAAGKPALVTTLEDDHKKYQLTVTPTKLR